MIFPEIIFFFSIGVGVGIAITLGIISCLIWYKTERQERKLQALKDEELNLLFEERINHD